MCDNNVQKIEEEKDIHELEFCGILLFLILSPAILITAACIIAILLPFFIIYLIFDSLFNVCKCHERISLRSHINDMVRFIKNKFRKDTQQTELTSINIVKV